MSNFIIETGIPMPKGTSRTQRYPDFTKMNVGDSVLFPTEGDDGQLARHSQDRRIRAYAKSKGVRIAVRRQADGLRVWRIE